MKIAICDDYLEDRKIIEKYLIKYANKINIEFQLSLYESGEALLVDLKKTSFQIIFLDIYMKALDGIDVAREVRKFDKTVQIVFITTSPDHAVSSYEVRALNYVLKPITYSKMEKVLSLCRFESVQADKQVEILTGKILTKIKLSEIVYAEVYNKCLTIQTTYGALESRTSLENFETLLGGSPFLRCHRSFVINMDFIEDAEGENFLLEDGRTVPISRPNKAVALKAYNEYIFSKMRKSLC